MEVRSGFATSPAGGVQLCFEDMGDVNDPPMLLIMGLGAQLLLWRTGFCEQLVARGFRVIRFDNRDVGLSSKTEPVGPDHPLLPRLLAFWAGRGGGPSDYTLDDMADDTAAVLDHLDIERAHIVGGSMGGMIAQVFAARFPARTRSLAVIFSSNNRPFLPPPGPRALQAILGGPPADATREAVIDNVVRVTRITGSPAYQPSEDWIRQDAAENYDRSFYPQGVARQFDAVLAAGSLRRYDQQISAPTVVIHGRADKLMRPSGGRAVAAAIRGARLVLFDGMGHDLPQPLWGRVISELADNIASAR